VTAPTVPWNSSLQASAGGLKAELRRTQRRRKLEAVALVAPLFLFLAVFFLAPIAAMLFRSLDNSELPSAMPRTAEVLRAWDGAGLPPEPVFATFGSELAAGQKARNLAGVCPANSACTPAYCSITEAIRAAAP